MSDPIRWSRTALDARIEALQEQHSGQALIDAVVDFAGTLTEEDRKVLQDVLLTRAGREARIDVDTVFSRSRTRYRRRG